MLHELLFTNFVVLDSCGNVAQLCSLLKYIAAAARTIKQKELQL